LKILRKTRIRSLRSRFIYLKNRIRLYKNKLSTVALKGNEIEYTPYIYVWESELKFMAFLTHHWGCIETGGDAYGYFSHAARPVVVFITPPGPNAIHEFAHFRQDTEYLIKYNRYLRDKYGIYYIGSMHSHHILSKKDLSKGDIESAHKIANKNGYRHICQFLTTFEKPSEINNYSQAGQNLNKKDVHCSYRKTTHWENCILKTSQVTKCLTNQILYSNYIKIKSHYYRDAAQSQPIHCPIHLIPGVSPIRKAIAMDTELRAITMLYHFPMFRVIIETI